MEVPRTPTRQFGTTLEEAWLISGGLSFVLTPVMMFFGFYAAPLIAALVAVHAFLSMAMNKPIYAIFASEAAVLIMFTG